MSQEQSKKLMVRLGERFGVDPDKLFDTLKLTAFRMKEGRVPTNEEMMALLIVADQHGLNPFCREIYAFPDKQGGIMPVVSVRGWERIINEHAAYDGIDWAYPKDPNDWVQKPGAKTACFPWITCIMFRKDRSHPTQITEFLDEAYRPPFTGNGKNGPYTAEGPWQTYPKRMLRHKALIQCAQAAFGFSGLYEPDEAERAREIGLPAIDSAEANARRVQSEIEALEPKLRPFLERARESYLQGAASLYQLQQAQDVQEASPVMAEAPAIEEVEVSRTDEPVQHKPLRPASSARKRQANQTKLPDFLETAAAEAVMTENVAAPCAAPSADTAV